jgi:exonuclease SbcD
MKFLHIADIHLGCTRYQLEESPKDFFLAWYDALKKYAVDTQVDFVIIAGDFFHKRNVEPQAMNHAVAGLELLRRNNIPVVVIEGNHDQAGAGSAHSWLRSLSAWGLLKLLEPHVENGRMQYEPWDESEKEGSFIDIGPARIFGSKWYGASANVAIPMHTDVEGYQTHPLPSLSMAGLKELRSVTDYVALGHTHKMFDIDNWCFNPGSLEITNIEEFKETRGVFVVEVDEKLEVKAEHLQDYRQRLFRRIQFTVSSEMTTGDLTAKVLEKMENETRDLRPSADGNDASAPIVEITLRGHLGFPNSLLEVQKIREETQKMTGALHVRLRNHTVPVEYAVAADTAEDITREDLERRVVEDLIARDARYKQDPAPVTDAIIGAKKMALGDEEPEKIADFIAARIAGRGI